MAVSINDLKIIASNGGGMILDARAISANDLNIIASNASRSGAQITLRNVDVISARCDRSDGVTVPRQSQGLSGLRPPQRGLIAIQSQKPPHTTVLCN
jgi:hypothetical protein